MGEVTVGLQALAEAWSQPVLITNRDQAVIFLNAAALTLGCVKGQPPWHGLPHLRGPLQEALVATAADGKRRVVELPEAPHHRWHVVPAGDGCTAWQEDLTALRELARGDAERNELSALLLTVLGHDLRNPVAAVKMAADFLVKSGTMTERQPKALARIVSAADRLASMFDQLLDFVRLRLDGGIDISPVPMDMHSLCAQLREQLELENPERTLVVTTSGDGRGCWDVLRLTQVLRVLLGNALVHGRRDAPVRITSVAGERELTVEIFNEGKVIPADVLTTIFDPLPGGQRSRSIRQADGNLGLGLYIASQVARSHGGRVEARSGEEGTAFILRLPRTSLPSPAR